MSDSPHEYIEKLKLENARLRIMNRALEDVVERQIEYIKELRRQTGHAPHDFEPSKA